MPSRPHANVVPFRVRWQHAEWECDVLRGVGHTWRCSCGAYGPIYRTREAAVIAKRNHEQEHRC